MNGAVPAQDHVEVESIALGYSASTLGTDEQCYSGSAINGKSLSSNLNNLSASVLSLNSITVPTKPPVILEKWYLQPVPGSKAVRVCGTKVSGGGFHKSSAIQVRVSVTISK